MKAFCVFGEKRRGGGCDVVVLGKTGIEAKRFLGPESMADDFNRE